MNIDEFMKLGVHESSHVFVIGTSDYSARVPGTDVG